MPAAPTDTGDTPEPEPPRDLLATLASRLAAESFTTLTESELLAHSRGPLSTPATLNPRTGRPERHGPLCMRVFGPVVDDCCMCTKYRGPQHRGVKCEKCGVTVEPASARAEYFGHIDLVLAVRHPWLPDTPIQRLLLLPPTLRLLPDERGDPTRDPDQHTRDAIATATHDSLMAPSTMNPAYEPLPTPPTATGLTALYTRTIARNEALRHMLPRAPDVIREHETELLQATVDELFGPPTTEKNPRGRRLRDLILAALARQDAHELDALLLASGLRAA